MRQRPSFCLFLLVFTFFQSFSQNRERSSLNLSHSSLYSFDSTPEHPAFTSSPTNQLTIRRSLAWTNSFRLEYVHSDNKFVQLTPSIAWGQFWVHNENRSQASRGDGLLLFLGSNFQVFSLIPTLKDFRIKVYPRIEIGWYRMRAQKHLPEFVRKHIKTDILVAIGGGLRYDISKRIYLMTEWTYGAHNIGRFGIGLKI